MMNFQKKGFTLVETLVAITILVISIVGPLYAVHRAIVASYTARDSLAATALAQEGAEFVRSTRDSNYLSNQSDWLYGLSTCMVTGAQGPSDYGCGPDISSGSLEACGSSGCTPLRLDTSYRYRQGGSGTPTRFARRVTISNVSPTEVEVIVQVTWSTLRIPYTVTVTEHLYNWQ